MVVVAAAGRHKYHRYLHRPRTIPTRIKGDTLGSPESTCSHRARPGYRRSLTGRRPRWWRPQEQPRRRCSHRRCRDCRTSRSDRVWSFKLSEPPDARAQPEYPRRPFDRRPRWWRPQERPRRPRCFRPRQTGHRHHQSNTVRARNAERSVAGSSTTGYPRRPFDRRSMSKRPGNDHDVAPLWFAMKSHPTNRKQDRAARKTERSPDGSSTTGVSAVTDDRRSLSWRPQTTRSGWSACRDEEIAVRIEAVRAGLRGSTRHRTD